VSELRIGFLAVWGVVSSFIDLCDTWVPRRLIKSTMPRGFPVDPQDSPTREPRQILSMQCHLDLLIAAPATW